MTIYIIERDSDTFWSEPQIMYDGAMAFEVVKSEYERELGDYDLDAYGGGGFEFDPDTYVGTASISYPGGGGYYNWRITSHEVIEKTQKLRVWWIPQVPMDSFYIPVSSPEEGKKVLEILAAYDSFQRDNNIKPDYSNEGGLEQWNEEAGEWEDWHIETENECYDSVDEYYDSEDCADHDKIEEFVSELWGQLI